jgi:alpha-glucosidase
MDTEHFVGRDLLVAPVLDPESSGNGHRYIYLPAGSDWYCFMDNAVPLASTIKGAQSIAYEAYVSTDPGHQNAATFPTAAVSRD